MKRRIILGAFVALIGLFFLNLVYYRWYFPYGSKSARLPVVMSALRSYAYDHEGQYPSVGATPLESLETLFPRYLADPVALAGISGKDSDVRKRIFSGRHLDTNISSWVYWPGLNEANNGNVAILWERASGVSFNGSRANGHAVGFANGIMEQISEPQWTKFMLEQKRLRESILTKH